MKKLIFIVFLGWITTHGAVAELDLAVIANDEFEEKSNKGFASDENDAKAQSREAVASEDYNGLVDMMFDEADNNDDFIQSFIESQAESQFVDDSNNIIDTQKFEDDSDVFQDFLNFDINNEALLTDDVIDDDFDPMAYSIKRVAEDEEVDDRTKVDAEDYGWNDFVFDDDDEGLDDAIGKYADDEFENDDVVVRISKRHDHNDRHDHSDRRNLDDRQDHDVRHDQEGRHDYDERPDQEGRHDHDDRPDHEGRHDRHDHYDRYHYYGHRPNYDWEEIDSSDVTPTPNPGWVTVYTRRARQCVNCRRSVSKLKRYFNERRNKIAIKAHFVKTCRLIFPHDHHRHRHHYYDHSYHDHSGYDHSGYDYSGYDHSGYDHSGYDYSGYDHSGYDNRIHFHYHTYSHNLFQPYRHDRSRHSHHGIQNSYLVRLCQRLMSINAEKMFRITYNMLRFRATKACYVIDRSCVHQRRTDWLNPFKTSSDILSSPYRNFFIRRAKIYGKRIFDENSLVCLNCRYRIQQLEGRHYPHYYLYNLFLRICTSRTTFQQERMCKLQVRLNYYYTLNFVRRHRHVSPYVTCSIMNLCPAIFDDDYDDFYHYHHHHHHPHHHRHPHHRHHHHHGHYGSNYYGPTNEIMIGN